MTTIVLLGGNGYIGKEVIRQWLERDTEAQLFVVGRPIPQDSSNARLHYIQADVSKYEELEKSLPRQVDYLVNLTYGTMDIVKAMRKFAEEHHVKVMGYINAILSPSALAEFGDNREATDFVKMKLDLLTYLQESKIRVASINLTVAYGNRTDDIGKMISTGQLDSFNPVRVEIAACMLIDEVVKNWLL
jgi:UDP-glucose 4-epimerase